MTLDSSPRAAGRRPRGRGGDAGAVRAGLREPPSAADLRAVRAGRRRLSSGSRGAGAASGKADRPRPCGGEAGAPAGAGRAAGAGPDGDAGPDGQAGPVGPPGNGIGFLGALPCPSRVSGTAAAPPPSEAVSEPAVSFPRSRGPGEGSPATRGVLRCFQSLALWLGARQSLAAAMLSCSTLRGRELGRGTGRGRSQTVILRCAASGPRGPLRKVVVF